jgi:hypothetical protein
MGPASSSLARPEVCLRRPGQHHRPPGVDVTERFFLVRHGEK